MSVETIRSISALAPEDGPRQIERSVGSASASGFAETLGGALQKVDQLQMDADVQAEKVAMGGGNLHEMSMALEKADVSMRLAMKVRNKLVEAYQEIMRMNV
ncbi:MAG: flagellar hook-basal body complex protein FliE [Pseudomonadota bacterium]